MLILIFLPIGVALVIWLTYLFTAACVKRGVLDALKEYYGDTPPRAGGVSNYPSDIVRRSPASTSNTRNTTYKR